MMLGSSVLWSVLDNRLETISGELEPWPILLQLNSSPPPKRKKKNDFHSNYIINVLVYIAFNK